MVDHEKKYLKMREKVGILEAMIEDRTRDLYSSQEELKEKAAFLSGIFDSMVDLLVVTDDDGIIISTNNSAAQKLGVASEKLVGRSFIAFCTERELLPKGLQILREKGSIKDVAAELTAGDGSTFPVHVSGAVMKGDESVAKRDAFVFIAHDVSELKRAEDEREKTRVLLMQTSKLAALGEMAGGIAHEINTPLAVISARTRHIKRHLLRDPSGNETALQFANIVEEATNQIAGIINGLMMFCRIDDSDPFGVTSIRSLFGDTLILCSERLRNAGIELRIEYPPAPIDIECRPTQISQVLINLINNARDAVEECAEKWIAIRVEAHGDRIDISISDSGFGIAKEHRERIFDPFFTTKEIGKGTGLGLSISKGLVEDHHGTLILQVPSSHTCFVISLPKTQPKQKGSR